MVEKYLGVYQFVTLDKLIKEGIAVQHSPTSVDIPSHNWHFSNRMISIFGNKVTITYEDNAYRLYVPQYQISVACMPREYANEMEAFLRICTDSGYMHKCTTHFTDLF
jgi:hypothetical protein